jgi:type II secretory pathway pseudopilin PulG
VRLRARVRDLRAEAGVTITEMMVVIALLGIVIPALLTAVTSAQRSESRTTKRFISTGEAQTILDRVAKDLRTATAITSTGAAFLSADVKDVTFYANLSDPNGPTKLHAFIVPVAGTSVADFHEDANFADANSAPNYTYNSVTKVRIDGRYVTTAANIFTYYDRNGTQLTTPITTLAALRSIDVVGVTLTTQVTPTAPKTTVVTRIHVRNVDYNPGP